MKHILILSSILFIIYFSCQKSQDENLDQMTKLLEQQNDKLKHLLSINPIEDGKITSRFGQRVDSLINKGIDIAVEKEADVFAVAAGKVVKVKKGREKSENLIVIDHGDGFQTRYSNLSDILVEANQSVKRWTVIGKIKKSADQLTLLHYEVIEDGEPVNPEKFIFKP